VTDCVQVSTATQTKEQAVQLAGAAVKAALAAGAQVIGPVTSVFIHLNEFGQGEEWQLILKTMAQRYAQLETFLARNHPWDNPEIAAIPIIGGSERYLNWISDTVTVER
jgi:periplasmic divalent cation tolerance protein